ncbi:polyprenyl synthetase family protein [Latilactobacillus graminis]|uniref:Polyprenyl synthetase family protein n=1 Tax=Latilactobacillus graminis TaxID=60519 RepID=A0ABX6C5W6_9LACO|nr:polyprenyl synthetase family protein [Latilactobacillus graminis]QFP78982.1 polyprenyl synthetase family protein [Latilactobacillus graminis]
MAKVHAMWQNYPEIETELAQSLALIEDNVHTKNQAVTDAILEMISAGGKLLRPAYCLLFSQFNAVDRQKMIALAAAVETLHTATLIHDDIVDDSALRRHQQSIQARFGKDVAVYAGDYLFVVCFKLLANYASDLKSIQFNSQTMDQILDGELSQMTTRYNLDLTPEQYLQQINGKTGQLFALSCFIGAYESQKGLKFARQAEKIGLNIGIAFQILDDILDYTQTDVDFGKPVLDDMRRGVYSIPLILTLQTNRCQLAPYLEKQTAMSDEDLHTVQTIVRQSNNVKKAQTLAQNYTKRALAGIAKLPDMPARITLQKLTKTLLTRTT